MTGRERVGKLMRGEAVDRQPLFDILRNDAVIEYCAGEPLTHERRVRVTRRAVARALDATRGVPKLPAAEQTFHLADGREARYQRWTRWIQPKPCLDREAYKAETRRMLERGPALSAEEKEAARRLFAFYDECDRADFKDIAFFWYFGVHDPVQFGVDAPPLAGTILEDIYHGIGMEEFSFLMFEDIGLVDAMLEYHFARAVETIGLLPATMKPFGIMYADDLAFKTGPFVNPRFFDEHYWHRMKRVVEAIHARGCWCFFHSDGNLNLLLDGIMSTGIDLLNPIERLAGMDIAQIHRKYPKLVMAGGIDVSQLLASGTPAEIKDEVRRAIDDAEGRILVGSTTEIHGAVPVENFIALREAVGAEPFLAAD